MSLILNIDTTAETAIVNIAEDGIVLFEEINANQKDHAAFVQPAIQALLVKAALHLDKMDAVAVCYGPGSYTGIRVGMASAKGLCYALQKPLITLNALEILAKDAIDNNPSPDGWLYCPMIDARRMEVFTAVFNKQLEEVFSPSVIILDNNLPEILLKTNILFFGNGAVKWGKMTPAANISEIRDKGRAMGILSCNKLQKRQYSSLAYTEPFYLKEFYTANNI